MKMKLMRPQQPPWGGTYTLNLPEKGMVGMGTSFEMLETNVRKYRKAMGIPTGLGFAEELQQETCTLYPNECEPADPNLPTQVRLGFEDVVHGTEVLVAFKMAGSPMVPKEEALRRSEICSRCKLCVPFSHPCTGLCSGLKVAVDTLIASSYEIPMDTDLRACGICHCFASSHVRLPYRFLERGLTPEMKVQFEAAAQYYQCWKTETAL